MNITFPKTVIEISPEEAIDLYYDVKRGLEHTIDTHWKNHPASYPQMEHRRLHMLVTLGRSVGHDVDVLKQLQMRLDELCPSKGVSP